MPSAHGDTDAVSELTAEAMQAELTELAETLKALQARRVALQSALTTRLLLPAWHEDTRARLNAAFGVPLPAVCAVLEEGLLSCPNVSRRFESGKYYDPQWTVDELAYQWRGEARRTSFEEWYNLSHPTMRLLDGGGGRESLTIEAAISGVAEELSTLAENVAKGEVVQNAEQCVLDLLNELPKNNWLPALAIAVLGFPGDWWSPSRELCAMTGYGEWPGPT